MNMETRKNFIKTCYDILYGIYINGAYSNIEINKVAAELDNKDRIIRIVYGVLDRDIELDYYIDRLSERRVKDKARIILKIALYCIIYMDSIPDYAIVDNAVDTARLIDKREYTSFINAVLNKFIKSPEIALPKNEQERMSVVYSKPLWLVKALIKQYGKEEAVKIMGFEGEEREHIRPNTRKITYDALKDMLGSKHIKYEESGVGGLYVENSEYIRELFNKGLITVQGKSSMLCVKAMGIGDNDSVLDLCAAPGGKSVYINEMAKNVHVTSCELHEHRAKLINQYIKRMGASNIDVKVNDATVYRPDWKEKFDKVLVDAPCSGLGVMYKKGDILLGKTMEDIIALSELQYKIINNAAEYVKSGGYIIYSTCTILREENYNIIGRLLKERDDIESVPLDGFGIVDRGCIQLLPHINGGDGFFIAKLRKK